MNAAQTAVLNDLAKELRDLQKTENSTAHSNTALTHIEQAQGSLKRHEEVVVKKAVTKEAESKKPDSK